MDGSQGKIPFQRMIWGVPPYVNHLKMGHFQRPTFVYWSGVDRISMAAGLCADQRILARQTRDDSFGSALRYLCHSFEITKSAICIDRYGLNER